MIVNDNRSVIPVSSKFKVLDREWNGPTNSGTPEDEFIPG